MKSLDEAWDWYRIQSRHNRLIERLAGRYWEDLPWGGRLGNDDDFRELEPAAVVDEAARSQGHLDDLAVLVLFSVFEGVVREHALTIVRDESLRVSHFLAKDALERAKRSIDKGSIEPLLDSLKAIVGSDTVGEVTQVRNYRNWVAHGKRDKKPAAITPRGAFDRLKIFLDRLDMAAARSGPDPAVAGASPPDSSDEAPLTD